MGKHYEIFTIKKGTRQLISGLIIIGPDLTSAAHWSLLQCYFFWIYVYLEYKFGNAAPSIFGHTFFFEEEK